MPLLSPSSPGQWLLGTLLALALVPALIAAFHTQSHAAVHQFLPPRLQPNQRHHHPLSLTPSESRLVYATIFGVSRFHTMGFVGQFSQVLDLQRVWRQDGFFEQDLAGGVVVSVAGVVEEHEEALVGRRGGGNVLFRIAESPHGGAFLDLMGRMMGQRGDVAEGEVQRLYANTMGGEIAVIPALEDSVVLLKEPDVRLFTDKFGEGAAKLYDQSIREDRYFISEILALDSFVEQLDQFPLFPSQFIMINLATLDGIYHKHGPRSPQYHTALKLFTPLLNTLQETLSTQHILTLTTIPPTSHAPRTSTLHTRDLEAAFGNEHSSPVLSQIQDRQHSIFGQCHDSEASCVAATNNCSAHGSCVESVGGAGCWSCLCVPSVRDVGNGGRMTTYWAGDECQKIDVSTPFHIFFWVLPPAGFSVANWEFVVGMVLTVVLGVRMLWSVGEEEMGGVLGSGVSPVKKH